MCPLAAPFDIRRNAFHSGIEITLLNGRKSTDRRMKASVGCWNMCDYLRQRYAFVRLSACLSVSKITRNACLDLYEMLHVGRCRDVDELINFWASPRCVQYMVTGICSGCRNWIAFSDIVCAMRCKAKFYDVVKIRRIWAPVAAARRGFKMVLFTASHENTFVGGKCALSSALLVVLRMKDKIALKFVIFFVIFVTGIAKVLGYCENLGFHLGVYTGLKSGIVTTTYTMSDNELFKPIVYWVPTSRICCSTTRWTH